MKKYLLEVKIYYKGLLSKKDEVGYLTLELMINKEGYKDLNIFAESSNSYDIEGERDVVPVGITKLIVNSAKVVKEENIKPGYDASFKYEITENIVKFITRGINVFFQIGLPKSC